LPRFVPRSDQPTRVSWKPRVLRPVEAAAIKRLLQIDPNRELGGPSLEAWLATTDDLTVREGCDCGCDSLFFDDPHDLGRPIASGVGRSADDSEVEIVLWARGFTLTFLELEPYGRTRRLARLPLPESIGPYPEEPEVVDDLE
jgi:hypothetical protein